MTLEAKHLTPEQNEAALKVVDLFLKAYAKGALNGQVDHSDLDLVFEVAKPDFGTIYDAHLLEEAMGSHYEQSDWRHDVANGDTRLGYEAWVMHNLEADGLLP